MLFHLRYVHWGGEMLDRSKGNGSCFACRLLLGHATRVMLLGRFWSVFVGTFARLEPWTLRLSRPLFLSPVLVFLVECCCFEVCCTELMVMLLVDAAFGRRSRCCRPDRRRRRSASCCLPGPVRALVLAAAHCIGPAAATVAPQNWTGS